MTFNYDLIEPGFYDKIFDAPDGMRKFWHWHKFDSVQRTITETHTPMSLLDVGCFSGSFAGRFLDENKVNSTSIDILETQIAYAQSRFQKPGKSFLYYRGFEESDQILKDRIFDVVTFIEVIEHLNHDQIRSFFEMVDKVTKKDSQVIITTPNYFSAWPILEIILNAVSDVKYEEQHITKFTTFNMVKKLSLIYPEFLKKYKVDILTTSHFLSPYIALVSYSAAQKISTNYRASDWKNPFGSIVILKLVKR